MSKIKNSLLQTSKVANKHNLWDLYGKSNMKYSRIVDNDPNQKPKEQQEYKNIPVKQPKYLVQLIFLRFIRSEQEAFNEIRNLSFNRKLRTVKLPLLEKKFKRSVLENGFLALKNLAITKTQKNIQNKINQRRNPNILIRNLNNLTKNKLTDVIRILKANSHRVKLLRSPLQNFCQVVQKQTKDAIQTAFNLICAKSQHSKIALDFVRQIQRMEEKAIRRIKTKAFNHLVQSCLANICQDQRIQRQQKIKELSDKKHQQHKILLNLRQSARTLQANISNQGFQKTKLAKDHTKQLRMIKAKTEEDCKQLQKQLALLRKEQSFISHQMSHKESYLNRRLKNKQISQNFFNNLQKLVKTIQEFKSQQFKNSDAVRAILPVKKSIYDVDQFAVHQNLRMKEEIRMYEGLNSNFNSAELNRSKLQNQKIRNMIEILIDKELGLNLDQEKNAIKN